jgi:hypothetical protein
VADLLLVKDSKAAQAVTQDVQDEQEPGAVAQVAEAAMKQ